MNDQEWRRALEEAIDKAVDVLVRSSRRRRTACHEAGHAVAIVRLRCGLARVTIAPSGRSTGHVVTRGGLGKEFPKTALTGRQRAKVERMIVCRLAGLAADLHFAEEQDPAAYKSDWDAMAILMAALGLSREEQLALIERLADRATLLVQENEVAIQAVANALIRQTRLSATEVRSIIADADASAEA